MLEETKLRAVLFCQKSSGFRVDLRGSQERRKAGVQNTPIQPVVLFPETVRHSASFPNLLPESLPLALELCDVDVSGGTSHLQT